MVATASIIKTKKDSYNIPANSKLFVLLSSKGEEQLFTSPQYNVLYKKVIAKKIAPRVTLVLHYK